MKYTDFSKGEVSVGDAQFIPQGAVRQATNCEYNKSPLLTIRNGTEVFSNFTATIGRVDNFCIWFPPNTLADSDNDYVIVYYQNKNLYMGIEKNSVWVGTIINITGVIYNSLSTQV